MPCATVVAILWKTASGVVATDQLRSRLAQFWVVLERPKPKGLAMSKRSRPASSKKCGGRSMGVSRPTSRGLTALESVFGALAEADSLEEIKAIRDKAEAVRQYAHSARANLSIQNKAAELKLRAERRAGELLQTMGLRGGDRKSSRCHSRPTLAQLGISEHESRRWQKEATVSEPEFCACVEAAENSGWELTSASLLRLARARRARAAKTQDSQGVDADELSPLETDVAPPTESPATRPHQIISEIHNHCATLEGMLTPPHDDGIPGQSHPCVVRTLQRLAGEIRNLLDELEQWATGCARS
jgi:hypothetical protein